MSPRFLLITSCPILQRIQGRIGSGLEKHLSDPLARKRQRQECVSRLFGRTEGTFMTSLPPSWESSGHPTCPFLGPCPRLPHLSPISSSGQGLRLILQSPLTPKPPVLQRSPSTDCTARPYQIRPQPWPGFFSVAICVESVVSLAHFAEEGTEAGSVKRLAQRERLNKYPVRAGGMTKEGGKGAGEGGILKIVPRQQNKEKS